MGNMAWEMLVTSLVTILGSSGIWGYITVKHTKSKTSDKLLRGISQHLIIQEGRRLIEKGYVTTSEYTNMHRGLYRPYKRAGGNGLAEKIINEVEKLPIRDVEGNAND
jgi:hypothetical protein